MNRDVASSEQHRNSEENLQNHHAGSENVHFD